MKVAFLTTAFSCLLVVVSLSIAQNTPISLSEFQKDVQAGAEKVGQPTKAPTEKDGDYARYRIEEGSNHRVLALSVMGTGLFSLFLLLWYLKSREATPETMVNGSGLVLVIFATVLVVILAKAEQQLTAATGILGAIAGYLFGKTTKGSGASEQTNSKNLTP
jgi:hypothetical protein